MWIPQTAEEVEEAVSRRDLTESPSFDAKRELTRNSSELAKDVAAMANDGGVLLYGVGEDSSGQLTELHPFDLHGAEERVQQIVATALHGPLQIQCLPLRCGGGPVGYLALVIPASSSAPHMVQARQDNRYYGRQGTTTVRLDGASVDRLVDRRRQWADESTSLLNAAVARVLQQGTEEYALVVLVHPVGLSDDALDRARSTLAPGEFLRDTAIGAIASVDFTARQHRWLSSLDHIVRGRWSPLGRSWSVADGVVDPTVDGWVRGEVEVTKALAVRVRTGGAGGRTEGGQNVLDEDLIAQRVTAGLAIAGGLLACSDYLGPCFVAMYVGNTEDADSQVLSYPGTSRRRRVPSTRFREREYRQVERVLSSEVVREPKLLARRLCAPLFEALSDGGFSPHDDPFG